MSKLQKQTASEASELGLLNKKLMPNGGSINASSHVFLKDENIIKCELSKPVLDAIRFVFD